MYRFFEAFIKNMAANFRGIARATKNEKTVEDLQQDAYIIAREIAHVRGHDVDFSDSEDQQLVMRYLNHRNVKRGDWKMRNAMRIDSSSLDDDGDLICWSRDLIADENSDPVTGLLRKEFPAELERLLTTSYSQATAYVLTFFHFGNDSHSISDYLAITKSTLDRRIRSARLIVGMQPSLFDRKERIDAGFVPLKGRLYKSRIEELCLAEQWGWDFEPV